MDGHRAKEGNLNVRGITSADESYKFADNQKPGYETYVRLKDESNYDIESFISLNEKEQQSAPLLRHFHTTDIPVEIVEQKETATGAILVKQRRSKAKRRRKQKVFTDAANSCYTEQDDDGFNTYVRLTDDINGTYKVFGHYWVGEILNNDYVDLSSFQVRKMSIKRCSSRKHSCASQAAIQTESVTASQTGVYLCDADRVEADGIIIMNPPLKAQLGKKRTTKDSKVRRKGSSLQKSQKEAINKQKASVQHEDMEQEDEQISYKYSGWTGFYENAQKHVNNHNRITSNGMGIETEQLVPMAMLNRLETEKQRSISIPPNHHNKSVTTEHSVIEDNEYQKHKSPLADALFIETMPDGSVIYQRPNGDVYILSASYIDFHSDNPNLDMVVLDLEYM